MFVEHKEAGEVTEAPAKVLKLSEAIRIGARLRPKCTMDMFADGGSCALGAAVEALTGRTDYYSQDVPPVERLWPELGGPMVRDSLMQQITYKNDTEGWSREYIADWLEAQGY